MKGKKRGGPKLHSQPATKRRKAVFDSSVATKTTGSCISLSRQDLNAIEKEDARFDCYLNDRSVTQQKAFAPELLDEGGEWAFGNELTSDDEYVVSGDGVNHAGMDDDGEKEEEDEVLEHAKELDNLKSADPNFYQFLLENDRELLGFGQDEELEDHDIDQNAEGQNGKQMSGQGERRLEGTALTSDRFNLIQRSAVTNKTLRGCNLMLAAYRGVIRSLAKTDSANNTVDKERNLKGAKKNIKNQERGEEKTMKRDTQPTKLLFHLDVEGSELESFKLFSEVISTVTREIGALLSTHVEVDESKDKGKNNGSDGSSIRFVYPKPRGLHKRFQTLINQFWIDTTLLLQYLSGSTLLQSEALYTLKQALLVNLASPLLLRWLVCLPERFRRKLILSLTTLWLEVCKYEPKKSMESSLHAFLVLQRNAALLGDTKFHAVGTLLNQKKQQNGVGKGCLSSDLQYLAHDAQQSLVAECYRAFIHVVSKFGYSWRTAAGYQFVLNCLVELLTSVNSSVAYRVIFLCTRQLSVVTRNTNIARSQHKVVKKNAATAKSKSRRLEEVERRVFSWSFIFSARFLVQAIGKIGRHLKPLAFPLSCTLTAAVKSELSALNRLPFVLHCLQLQCDLMSFLEVWIPLGSHLLALGVTVLAHQGSVERPPSARVKSSRGRNAMHVGNMKQQQQGMNGGASTSSVQKAPDLDLVFRLSDRQLVMPQVADQLVLRWIDLFVDHLGLLSRHPSFPEASTPVVFHLKNHSKCRNEMARKELKQLLSHCEISLTEVKQKRFILDPMKDVVEGKLLLFAEADISLARYRATRLKQRLELLTLKMNAEKSLEEQEDHELLDESSVRFNEVDIDIMSASTTTHANVDGGDTGDQLELFALDTDSDDTSDVE